MTGAGSFWLAGSNHGLFRSRDGRVWEAVGHYVYRVTSIRREVSRVCVGVGSGLWEVRESPDPWVQLHDETLTEVMGLEFASGDPGVVAASAYGVATGKRDEVGAVRWNWKSDGLAVNERFSNVVVADPEDVSRWLVGTEAGVLVTEDCGERWVHTGLTGVPVRAICWAMDAWWAGTDERGIWRSLDGVNWKRAGKGLDEGTVFALCSCGERMLAGTLAGVVIGDGSGRWEQAGGHMTIAAVAAHPEAQGVWMAGAAPGGVWATEDNGQTWRHVPGVPEYVEALLAPEGRA
ncbi:MAG: hypothetical protein O2954_17200 [bacterium]|nr:hypothetical protein [bacterium]